MKPKNIVSLIILVLLGLGLWAWGRPDARLPEVPPSGTVATSSATTTVKAFFSNRRYDLESLSCDRVYPTFRVIAATTTVGRAALLELLAGPTETEKTEGFVTALNSGILLQSLKIENGVARADFSSRLGEAVGGSCRVAAIRAQITRL